MPAKKSRKTASAPVKPAEKDVCFTIMPFGGWLDDYYETIYCPAIKAAGLEPHRADDLFRPSTIVNDIWAYTKRAKLLLADLTGKNPNVFYELGLAHALGKPAILVSESMEDIPFDLRALRILIYDKNAPEWGRLLREKIESSIKEVLRSPLEAVLPGFLDVKGSQKPAAVSPHEKEILVIKQELDLLRREIRLRMDRPRVIRHGIGAGEARTLIQSWVAESVPEEVIMQRLGGFQAGPPPSWIHRTIDEFLAERAGPGDPSPTEAEPESRPKPSGA